MQNSRPDRSQSGSTPVVLWIYGARCHWWHAVLCSKLNCITVCNWKDIETQQTVKQWQMLQQRTDHRLPPATVAASLSQATTTLHTTNMLNKRT